MTDITNLLGKVHNVDCLEFMKQLPDKCVDFTLTSPPYNTNMRYSIDGGWAKMGGHIRGNKYQTYNDDLYPPEYFDWQKNVITECLRVTTKEVFYNIQMLTGNKLALMQILGHFHDRVKEVLIWDKLNSEPSIQDGILNSEFEFIIVFSNDAILRRFSDYSFPKGTQKNIIRIPKNKENIDGHSALMPIALAKHIIREFSRGGIWFDPFCGCGTTATAAEGEGRKWITTEIDAKYSAIAEKRIEAERAQLKLF